MLNKKSGISFLLLLYFFIELASFFSVGYYYFAGFVFLVFIFILALIFLISKGKVFKFPNFEIDDFCWVIFTISLFFSMVFKPPSTLDMFQWVVFIGRFILSLLLLLCLLLKINLSFVEKIKRYFFIVFFSLGILIRFTYLVAIPLPHIDVYSIILNGVKGLSNGVNPYQMMFPKMYKDVVPDYFSYFPGVLIFFAPFVLIFGDPRVGIIFLEAFFVLILRKLLTNGNKANKFSMVRSFYIPLMLFFHPFFLLMVTQCYFEIVVLFFILLLFLLIVKKKQWVLIAFVLSLAMYFKQHMMIMPIFLSKIVKKRVCVIAYVLLTLLIAPFFLWSPKDFISDVLVGDSSSHSAEYFLNPTRHDGLTLNSFLYDAFRIDVSPIILIIFWFLLGIFIYYKIRSSIADVLFGLSLWFFGFFVFNKLAFVNYYYFIDGLLLLTLVAALREGKNAS